MNAHPSPVSLPAAEFQARMKRLSALQRRLRLDALFVVTDINRLYFTGLEASNGVLLAQATRPPAFYTDFRYLAMARKHAAWLPSRTLWKTADEQETVAGLGRSWRRVGYEGGIPAARFLKLRQALPDAEWIDIAPDIAELRAVKSPAEQRLMRAAVAANDVLFARLVRDSVMPGASEWALRGTVRVLADALGHGEAFDTIVCAGRNGAECHHHPDDTVLRRGQPLLVDVGIKLNHYCSDMTRCVHLGTPAPLWRDVYRIVLEANQQAIQAIRPGVPCCDIDAVARRMIEKAGYGACFGHSLGHGLGLEVHESPTFSTVCKTPLKPGMVLTVEPGIYLPGKLGIRIEDVILVTRDGCDVLTQTPKELPRF